MTFICCGLSFFIFYGNVFLNNHIFGLNVNYEFLYCHNIYLIKHPYRLKNHN